MNWEGVQAEQRSALIRGWHVWASRVLARSQAVAEESDRWFLCGVRRLERCAHGVESLTGFLLERVLTLPGCRRRSPRERILRLLETEAKRARVTLPAAEFALFSARMAGLIELVLNGTLRPDDIAFQEEDPEQPPAAPGRSDAS